MHRRQKNEEIEVSEGQLAGVGVNFRKMHPATRKAFMQPKLGLDPGSDTIMCPPWKLVHISEPHFPTLQNEGDNTYHMYDSTKTWFCCLFLQPRIAPNISQVFNMYMLDKHMNYMR